MDESTLSRSLWRTLQQIIGGEVRHPAKTGAVIDSGDFSVFLRSAGNPVMANQPVTSRRARPKTITEYINAAPEGARKKLREMRACIRTSAPGATESLKWGMPAFSHRRILVTFAAFKHHIGFYPTPSAVRAFANDLSTFVTAEGSIQFPLEKPLPLPLIRRITAFRVRENTEEDGKWRT